MRHEVFIGIGSNLGRREENCERAIALMNEAGVRVTDRSSKYETEPWGVKDQPPFINMAVRAETELDPSALLRVLKGIEKTMGRKPAVRWGPRVIDLDILIYDDISWDTPELKIPHPLMLEREFVMEPLVEIAPALVERLMRPAADRGNPY